MPTVPKVGPAISVLSTLQGELRQALDDPPSPEICRDLLKQLTEVGQLGVWCRDAALALGRNTDPQLTWLEMQHVTGVSDATLHDRYRRWSAREEDA